MSIVSFALIGVFIIFAGYVYSDSLSNEIGTGDAKQRTVGEWDCDDTGCLVINSDNTYYFYMDSSKVQAMWFIVLMRQETDQNPCSRGC